MIKFIFNLKIIFIKLILFLILIFFVKNTYSNELEPLKEILNKMNANLYSLLFVESNPIPVKWMLYKMGLIKQFIRLPLIELDETFHDEVMSELNKHKLI